MYDCLQQKPKEHHRCKRREQHHQLKRLLRLQQHLRQEHSLSELETKLAKIHNLHRYVELQHSWQSVRNYPYHTSLLKRGRIPLEKLTNVKDAIIKVVPRTDATTKPLTGRWVDTIHDDGARKSRWTTRGYEQTLNGNEDFFSATPAMMHLKMMLVDAALKGHVAAIGDCSGAFYQSPLNPDGTESKVWIEPSPEAELGQNYIWEAVSAFPGLKGAPRAWDTYSANVLTNSMQLEQLRYDGCLFYRFEPSREQVEENAGRHNDDFLVTGPEANVERFLAQAKDKLNMQDAVRLYNTGDEGRLLAMNLRKLEKGYALQGNPFLFTELLRKMPKQVPYQNPSARNHKTMTINHLHRAMHESSKLAWAKLCTSVVIVQTYNTV